MLRHVALIVIATFFTATGCATAADDSLEPVGPRKDGGGIDTSTTNPPDGTTTPTDSSSMPDTFDSSAPPTDTAVPDTGDPDTGDPDTGDPDTGPVDTGPVETGPTGTPCLYCDGLCSKLLEDYSCALTCAMDGYACKWDATKSPACTCY